MMSRYDRNDETIHPHQYSSSISLSRLFLDDSLLLYGDSASFSLS